MASNGINAEAANADYDEKTSRAQTFETAAGDSEEVCIDPRHEVQVGGGIADFWYLDDGDILCYPILVMPYLEAFDCANREVGLTATE